MVRSLRTAWAWCFLGAVLLGVDAAQADTVETALMPGQVIEGHAKWEEDCTKCHKRFDRKAQAGLCQDCHKDVRKDIASRQGLHGRLKDKKDCKDCHTEHKGRMENIAPLEERTFDHDQTDFALRGAHGNATKVACKSCHKPKVKYRDAPSVCYACHKKDDVHKGRVGGGCADCHSDSRWKDIRFDHSGTSYPLRGKHADTACKACHAEDRYKATPSDCYSCHKKDDKHKGQEGTRCEECHQEQSWRKAPFDHNKSRFPLLGKHQRVECKKCHSTPAFKETPQDCYACHKKDDAHKGSYGEKCGTCHAERDWSTIVFDHALHTKYPLFGGHLRTKCESCHKTNLYKDPTPVECVSCHKKEDRHKGRYGERCAACHTERNWTWLLFTHERDTTYPLKGYHQKVKCDSCHKGMLYKEKTSTACVGCHKKDDIHRGSFGEQCDKCHTEQSWTSQPFDHDRDTTYPLLGKHRTVLCQSCHTGRLYTDKTPTTCHACHKSEDAHRRRLGSQCGDCHNAREWKIWDFDHNTRTRFPLEGGHAGVTCAACHQAPMTTKVTASSACVSCHKKDDKHGGGYGPQCDSCHQTADWKSLKRGAGGFRLR